MNAGWRHEPPRITRGWIALPSRSHHGDSRIVPLLRPGAGVTTTRAHVHYVVTEFGVANLYGFGSLPARST